MEIDSTKWNFVGAEEVNRASACTIRSILNTIYQNVDQNDPRPLIPLGHGDPSGFPSFRTSIGAEEAVIDALRSAKYNCCAAAAGLPEARRSVAKYLTRDHHYELSSDDVYITAGARQAIDVVMTIVSRPGVNILLPRPGYPMYEARATFSHLEIRYFDLLPEKAWEVDLNGLEAVADSGTVAMVIINPGNPCGNVYTHEHLQKIAETARKLGILVIADEAYGSLTLGSNHFTSMAVFGDIVPVLTIGSLSKRWMVPGWRLGWIVTCDPNGILKNYGIIECINNYLNITCNPPTFIQGALSLMLENTPEEFYSNTLNILRDAADICYDRLKEIPCISCPHKPEGSMFVMVKLNLSLLEGIEDDVGFCSMLAKEESVIVLPGVALGLKNWLRIAFAVEHSSLEDGLGRMKAFCSRHAKNR